MIARRQLGLALLAALAASGASAQDRVVAIGGSVTEIVFALGRQDRLIARDSTSTYPQAAVALPDVGYMRALSPEGVLATTPDLVLADEGAGPPEAIEVLKAAHVPVIFLPGDPSAAGIAAKVRRIGRALDAEAEAETLAARVEADLAAARARAEAVPPGQRRRVLFVLSAQGGRILASGRGTAAASVIALAGGINAVEGFEGYKPLTDEAVIAAAPDVLLLMDRGGGQPTSDGDLLALPAVAATPAARTGALIRMDGLYLLGFGPRTAAAVTDLARALYGG